LSHSCLCLWLHFGIRIIINVLQDHPLVRVRKLSRDEVAAYQQATVAKYPSLPEVWRTLDGLNLNIQSTKDDKAQSIFYNGWIRFRLWDGWCNKDLWAQCPGTMHGSTLADYRNTYEKLEAVFDETGGKVVVDSVLHVANNNVIIKSGQNVPLGNLQVIVRARDATSICQSSGWGMRQFQSSFPRVKDEFHKETQGEQCIIPLLVVYLFNYRRNLVGCNQVQSAFMPYLEANALAAHSIF
jgi:hypothetical protein